MLEKGPLVVLSIHDLTCGKEYHPLYQPVKLRHRARFDGIHDVNVGFHGLVVGVAGPFHDVVGSDAHGEGVNDEGATTGVGADEFPLGLDYIVADVALVGGDSNREFFLAVHHTSKVKLDRILRPFRKPR